MSDSLQLHGLQHARPPCPSPTPGVYANSWPLSWWCHPTISSSVVPFSSHLPIFPIIRIFSNESALPIRWPKYWSFSFTLSSSNEHSGLISFRIDWLDLLANERLLLNHANTPGFLAPGGEEFNPGPETRLDRSELLCNKVLLKCKGDRESFWHRHQKGAERVPPHFHRLQSPGPGLQRLWKVCPFFLFENSRPLSPWGPLDFLSTCLGNDSLKRMKFCQLQQLGWTCRILCLVKYQTKKDKILFIVTYMRNIKSKTNKLI